ncbi:MAG TPA: GIY-YIG nuclease family protein [Tissierellaceae bacterium]|nr:GIY-YIG nuclease family protein [Tissierellaceae bacterium]
MSGKVYMIENLINGKKYVGATTGDITRRFNSHKCKSHHNSSEMYKDMIEYGKNNFKLTVLEEGINNCETLAELELHHIIKHKAWKDGYNTLLVGGAYNNAGVSIRVCKLSKKDNRVISIYDSMNEAGKECNLSVGAISECISGKRLSVGGYYWCKEDELESFEPRKRQPWSGKKCKVNQIDMITGRTINTFDSISSASKHIGGSAGTISNILNGIGYSYKGFRWERV